MHKTCLYRYKKQFYTILFTKNNSFFYYLKKALPSRQGQWSNLDCIALTCVWAKAEVAQCSVSNCGFGVTPKVISLGVNFSVPTDQNFIPKASKSSKGGMVGFAAN